MTTTADWLGELQATATQDYALGEALFLRMLSETQGIDVTLEALRTAAPSWTARAEAGAEGRGAP